MNMQLMVVVGHENNNNHNNKEVKGEMIGMDSGGCHLPVNGSCKSMSTACKYFNIKKDDHYTLQKSIPLLYIYIKHVFFLNSFRKMRTSSHSLHCNLLYMWQLYIHNVQLLIIMEYMLFLIWLCRSALAHPYKFYDRVKTIY